MKTTRSDNDKHELLARREVLLAGAGMAVAPLLAGIG